MRSNTIPQQLHYLHGEKNNDQNHQLYNCSFEHSCFFKHIKQSYRQFIQTVYFNIQLFI